MRVSAVCSLETFERRIRGDYWLQSLLEKEAVRRVEAGQPVRDVYCWYYSLCRNCLKSLGEHVDQKCLFGSTEFSEPWHE